MVTVTASNSTFKLIYDGDQIHGGAELLEYLKTRCELKFISLTRDEVIKISIHMTGTDGGGNTVTTDDVFYYTDPHGKLTISMRDWYRWMKEQDVAWAYVTVTSYTDLDGSTTQDAAQTVVAFMEGISYYAVGAPKGKDYNDATDLSPLAIMPPNVILNPSWGYDVHIESNYMLLNADGSWSGAVYGILDNEVRVKNSVRTLTLYDKLVAIKTYDLPDVPTCQDILAVEWTSLTGVKRRHYFPIVGFIRGNGDKVELEATHDGYDVRKANFTAVRCRLTGLTQWGYYYYMDLLQASDAHAIVLGSETSFQDEIEADNSRVFIEGESAETPSGTGFFNFEFVANLKQYAI